MRTIITILLILTIHIECFCQKKQIAVYNVAFGAITAGIGSAINKKSNEKRSHAFIKGIWKGALGGSICFAGKSLTYQILKQKNLSYAWPAKLVHSTGISIIENASSNSGFMEEWNTEIGVVRVGYNFKTNKPQSRIVLSRVYGALKGFHTGIFDAKKSIQTGQLFFHLNRNYDSREVTGISHYTTVGVAEYIQEKYSYKIIAHEIIHCYQTEQQMCTVKTFQKKLTSLNKFSTFRNFNKVFYLENFIGYRVYLKVNRYSVDSYRERYNEVEAYYLSSHRTF